MNVQTAFWEMLSEIGSSVDELLKLDIGHSFEESPIIRMWAVKLDSNSKICEEEVPSPNVSYQIQVLYNTCDVDLRDPESFQKAKFFLEKVRGEQVDRSNIIILDKLLWSNDADV